MKEQGEIIKIKGKFATVRVNRSSACGECHACGMKPEDSHIDVEAEVYEGAAKGDIVNVDIPEGSVAKMSLVAYAIPLVLGLIPFTVACLTTKKEWFALILLFLGVAVGYAFIKILDLSVLKKKPRVTISKAEVVEEIAETCETQESRE